MTSIENAPPDDRTIIVRGDLFSDSGYGRATRALSALLSRNAGRLLGVSLHEHAARRANRFPFTVIPERALLDDPRLAGACVVHVCLPDSFLCVPGCRNIGYYFWETEQAPPHGFWKAKMRLMDELWAPSIWQAGVLKAATGRRDIPVVPWPQGIDPSPVATFETISSLRAHPPQRLDQLANYLLRISSDVARQFERDCERTDHESGQSARFDPLTSPTVGELMARGDPTFLAIQTDAPRKGLTLLLAAWMQFRQTDEGRHAKLIIKTSSIDVTIDMYRLHFYMSLAARRLMRRLSLDDCGLYFIYDRLPDAQLNALIAASDALVSATMGEGFGGPLAEAFQHGVPVICPSHTSCRDILGPDYPLAVSYAPHRQKLWNNIDVYSSASIWNLVDDVSLVQRLQDLTRMTRQQRKALAVASNDRINANMGAAAVGKILAGRLTSVL